MSKNNEKSRVFIVDDHPLVREGLINLINRQPDFVVSGDADNAPEALQMIEKSHPDLAIVDIMIGSSSGLELIKDMKRCCASTRAIVLSMHEESFYAERALRAGAYGYVMKRETSTKIVDALRQVLKGELYVSQQFAKNITKRLIESDKQESAMPIELLSDRELEVFDLMGRGYDTRQIAQSLNLGLKTIQTYYARIKEKLNVATLHALLREAVRWAESKQRE